MAFDFSRVIQAAAEAVAEGRDSAPQPLKEGSKKAKEKGRGLSMPSAFLVGAGVVAVGRLLVGSRRKELMENLQERLEEYEHAHFNSGSDEESEEDLDAEAVEDEEPEGEYEDEPEAEEDEEPEDEYEDEDEPEAEYEDEEEPEDEYEGEDEPEAEYEDEEEPEDEYDEDEERPRSRRSASRASR